MAFIATLGALMAGYWAGYSVGTGSANPVTVAEASEKASPASQQLALPPPAESSAIEEPEAAAQPPDPAKAGGLHLQVSALSSQQAAVELRRELEGRGYPVRVDQPSSDRLVRVYVGPVPDNAELRSWTAELRKEGLEPFPKRL